MNDEWEQCINAQIGCFGCSVLMVALVIIAALVLARVIR
jgi:hypothetical protein